MEQVAVASEGAVAGASAHPLHGVPGVSWALHWGDVVALVTYSGERFDGGPTCPCFSPLVLK